ncbi:MAG: hypothetical protein IJA97_01905 [Clostridia bacterium]|nr:hypothetical protein [Clostridia bacterium]
MCFFNKAIKTKNVYAYLERTVPEWQMSGIPKKSERTSDNFVTYPPYELDKKFCSYYFSTKIDGFETAFRVRYSRLNKTLYVYATFKGLSFGSTLDQTKERFKKRYEKFLFTYDKTSTEICYFEWTNVTDLDGVERCIRNFIDEWEKTGIYKEMQDYYHLFK